MVDAISRRYAWHPYAGLMKCAGWRQTIEFTFVLGLECEVLLLQLKSSLIGSHAVIDIVTSTQILRIKMLLCGFTPKVISKRVL